MASMTDLRTQLARAKSVAMRIKEKGDEAMGVAFAALEVGAVAGAFGVAEGYMGEEIKVGGISAELVTAAGLHAYGLLSGTRHNEHVHNLANGAVAVAAFKSGKKLGERAKKNKTEKGSVFGEDSSPAAPQARFFGSNVAPLVPRSTPEAMRAANGLPPRTPALT